MFNFVFFNHCYGFRKQQKHNTAVYKKSNEINNDLSINKANVKSR